MGDNSKLSDTDRHTLLYAALGRLLSVSNAYHNTLVVGMSNFLNVDKTEAMIVFHPRSTGDLTATLKALIKHRAKSDSSLPVDKICDAIGKINKLRSRTNHVHGHMTFYNPKLTKDKGIIAFSRPDISGGTFSVNQTDYYSLEEVDEIVHGVLKHLGTLRRALNIHDDETEEYLNLLRES